MSQNEIVEIGITKGGKGYGIFRVPNEAIGGFDYVSGECYQIVVNSANANIEILEMIVADLKKLQGKV